MRHFFGINVVLFLLTLLGPISSATQKQKPGKAASSSVTTHEITLKVSEGPAHRVKGHIPKDRRAPGVNAGVSQPGEIPLEDPTFRVMIHPRETRLMRGKAFHGDVRDLPQVRTPKFERPEREEPTITPVPYPGTSPASQPVSAPRSQGAFTRNAPAPSPSNSFEGLDFTTWGAGHPGDTNGDVGPQHFIQTINTAVGIYRKSDGVSLAAFTFNTLMSQGSFGNLCDTNNFGDPVVLYDTFEDRWVITDFAFQIDGSGNVVNPPGAYQCFAVSQTGDPVSGGWNFYSVLVAGGLGDYPKLGIWPDGIYMSANVFGFAAGAAFQNPRVWAFNKAQMYAGTPTVQVLSFDAPSAEFTLLPANARLQTGTPPPGSPNYFAVVAQFLNTVSVYKFHADWNNISTSTFSGPFLSLAATSWSQFTGASGRVPSPANSLDTLYPRLMVQNQYTNIGGVESLWDSHTVGAAGASSAQAAVRYYQVDVTGGTVAANTPQAFTFSPDATVHRFIPSVAVDHAGDMAIGYSASSATLNPALRYAGRLAGDAVNSITQSETSLIEGGGTQSGTCGGTCTRWGDYSAMTLDPDGCTFWYTAMYYQTTGLAFNTRIGAFSFPSCTVVGTGTLQGTITALIGGSPIQGATVSLGSRTTTTDASGFYSFTGLLAGTYPSVTAAFAGYNTASATAIVVSDGGTTIQDFALTLAATSGCLTDTTQADFQAGVPTVCDLTSSPGDVTLVNAPNIDQQNSTISNTGVGITATTWGGQTFTPAVTGQLTRLDVNLFCSGCTGTTPNLTLSVRNTSGNLPTGADLATATITGFSSGASGYYTATFSTPPTLTAGTVYAFLIHPITVPSPGTYALTRSSTNVYAGGQRVASSNSGGTWTAPLTAGQTTDAGFRTWMQTGFAPLGTFVSSIKDANPISGASANWGTLSWAATTPAGTGIQFQAAASNNPAGPFNFVGPDNTASTFFSSGDSLAQFNSFRYLKYQAKLTTSDGTVTPTLSSVTICFSDVVAAVTSLAVSAAGGSYGGTADLSATLTSGGTGVSGKSVSFTLNGNSAGSATTDSSGVATVTGVSLTGINAGSYPAAVAAAFAGDSAFTSSNGTADLTVSKAAQVITFGALASATWGDADFSVSATSSSGLTVSFAASGNCTVTVTTVHITGAGSCTITASQAGDSNYNAATDAPQSFTIAKAAQTVTFGALAGKNFGDADFSVSATASSTLTVSFGASGSCTVTGVTVHITGAGSCTVTASQIGDANYNAATDVPQTFSIAKAGQTITFGALAGKNFGDADFAVSSTASSGLTVSFSASGNCTVTGATAHITGAGSCTITASQPGDSNYNAATDVPQTFAIAKAAQTITFGALGGKSFGNADFAVSSTTTSGLTVSFSASGSCTVTGTTIHLTGAGSCTITASQAGDSNYNAATDVPQTFSIAKSAQTITFGALSGKIIGDPDFNVSATASSGLTVSFAAGGACTIAGTLVHLTGTGTCTITASQAGDVNFNAATSVPQAFTVGNPDFTVTPTIASVTVKAGQTATEHITFTSNPPSTAVTTFTCSGLPALTTCTFAPPSVPIGSTLTDVVMTIGTTATTAQLGRQPAVYAAWLPFIGLGLFGLVFAGTRRKKTASFAVMALMLMFLMMIGCGAHLTPTPPTGTPGTPAGTSTVTVTATSGAITHTTTFSLTVN